MNIKLILILVLLFETPSFAQNFRNPEIEKDVCSKVLQSTTLFKEYIKRQSLSASLKAVKLLDTAQLLIKRLNKDSLVISSEDFTKSESIIAKMQKMDYKKTLANEKKAHKVKVTLEGEVFMLSKNNFMPLYTIIRIIEDIFHEWNEKL